jgi:hypothetical protein
VRQRIIKGKEVCAMKEKPLDINQLMLLIRTMQEKASWLRAAHRDGIENGLTRKTIVSYMGMEFARLHWKTRCRPAPAATSAATQMGVRSTHDGAISGLADHRSDRACSDRHGWQALVASTEPVDRSIWSGPA